jgi:hypothetical protein
MGLFRTSASNYEAPNMPPGTYVMTCVGLKPVTIEWDGQSSDRLQWSFRLQVPGGNVYTIEKLTDPAKAGPKSMNWQLGAALLGPENMRPDMDINEVDVLGHSALGTMGIPTKPDGQPGKFGLVGMVPLPMGMTVPGNGNGAQAPAQPPATVSPIRTQPVPAAPVQQTVRAAIGAPEDDEDLPF